MRGGARWRDRLDEARWLRVECGLTTRARMREGARGLRGNGARHVATIAVAATHRRGLRAANEVHEGDSPTPIGSS